IDRSRVSILEHGEDCSGGNDVCRNVVKQNLRPANGCAKATYLVSGRNTAVQCYSVGCIRLKGELVFNCQCAGFNPAFSGGKNGTRAATRPYRDWTRHGAGTAEGSATYSHFTGAGRGTAARIVC